MEHTLLDWLTFRVPRL